MDGLAQQGYRSTVEMLSDSHGKGQTERPVDRLENAAARRRSRLLAARLRLRCRQSGTDPVACRSRRLGVRTVLARSGPADLGLRGREGASCCPLLRIAPRFTKIHAGPKTLMPHRIATHNAKDPKVVVVFDLDGTLVDSSQVLLHAHDIAWSTLKLPRPTNEAILELVGLPLRDTMLTLAPEQDPEPLCALYSEAYVAAAPAHEHLFDGIAALLAHPFRAAVATGKSQRGAERVVKQHGFSDRFEAVFGGDAVPRPKPHPDMLQAIMQGTQCENLIMIGDTTYDLEMAQAAGAAAIGVSWGHHATERLTPLAPVVHSVSELSALLGL